MLGKRSVLTVLAVLGSFPRCQQGQAEAGMQILRNFVFPIVPEPPPRLHRELQGGNRGDLW